MKSSERKWNNEAKINILSDMITSMVFAGASEADLLSAIRYSMVMLKHK